MEQLDRYWADFPETRQNLVAKPLTLLSSLDSNSLAGDEGVEPPHTDPESDRFPTQETGLLRVGEPGEEPVPQHPSLSPPTTLTGLRSYCSGVGTRFR